MKNYKKKSICPAPLQTIIDLVNLLPPDAADVMDKIDDLQWNNETTIKKGGIITIDISHPNAHKYSWDVLFKDSVGNEIYNYCAIDGNDFFRINERYNDLLEAQFLFNVLNEENEKLLKGGERFSKDRFRTLTSNGFANKRPSGFTFDAKGYIRPYDTALRKILIENNVTPDRIKKCPICDKFFWAKQVNSKTCGDKSCSFTKYNQDKAAATAEKKAERKKQNEQDFSEPEKN